MATNLSESSVNSLLRLINQADTSASYNEKVDLLKKSRILAGDTEYSSLVNKSADYKLRANTTRETVIDFGDYYNDSLVTFLRGTFDIVNEVLNDTTEARKQETVNELTDILNGAKKTGILGYSDREKLFNQRVISQVMMKATELDAVQPTQWYLDLAGEVLSNGISYLIAQLFRSHSDPTVPDSEIAAIRELVSGWTDLGFNLEDIAYSTSNKLNSFFTDGLYNFTYITYPTKTLVNGISGTGSGLISSYKDIYTNRVVKKELDQTAIPSFTLKLQSFDIMTKYITMATNGSSSVGKFRFISDTLCNVMYYGYSSLFGKFYTCKTVIQKTPLGFAIKSSIVNPDHSTTLYYAALYTRVSLPLDKIKTRLLKLPADIHGNVSVSDVIEAIAEEVIPAFGGQEADIEQLIKDKIYERSTAGRIGPSKVMAVLETLGGAQ
jgi:hypothetical protein